MKKLIIIIFCCIVKTVFGQDLPNSGFEKVRLLEADKEIVAEIRVPNKNVHTKKDLFYAWYQANTIHSTQGGYSGKLLNGQYTEYYQNRNLKEQGTYKNGLKTGNWRDWKEDGTLLYQHTWKDGTMLPDSTVSFWKRLPFIHKKKSQPVKEAPKS